MTTLYKLCGVVSPLNKFPNFFIPVYECDGLSYVQKIDISNNIVLEFEQVDDLTISNHEAGSCEELKSVGDSATFCFGDSSKRLHFGNKDDISEVVRKKYRDYFSKPNFCSIAFSFSNFRPAEYLFCESSSDHQLRVFLSKEAPGFSKRHKTVMRRLQEPEGESIGWREMSNTASRKPSDKGVSVFFKSNCSEQGAPVATFIKYSVKKNHRIMANEDIRSILENYSNRKYVHNGVEDCIRLRNDISKDITKATAMLKAGPDSEYAFRLRNREASGSYGTKLKLSSSCLLLFLISLLEKHASRDFPIKISSKLNMETSLPQNSRKPKANGSNTTETAASVWHKELEN